MKKTYEKPRIGYESFALSDRISSGCEGIANLGENDCSVTPKDLIGSGLEFEVFGVQGICQYTGPGYSDYFCYHAPTEWNNVYSS